MVRLATALALLLLLGYGVFKAVPLLAGPAISVASPSESQSFPDGFVAVEGTAHHTEELSLNGAPLLIDSKGHFATTLVLPAGATVLTLSATDRFGARTELARTVFVPSHPAPSASTSPGATIQESDDPSDSYQRSPVHGT